MVVLLSFLLALTSEGKTVTKKMIVYLPFS